MSASDNLSAEQFEAHRIILGADKLKQPVGQYWSSDHNEPYAYEYAGVHGEKPPSRPHLIVTANYNPKDEAGGWSDANKPVNLKEGSSIKVTEVRKLGTKRSRTRKYNPPREMKA
jgi:hypothetical protein